MSRKRTFDLSHRELVPLSPRRDFELDDRLSLPIRFFDVPYRFVGHSGVEQNLDMLWFELLPYTERTFGFVESPRLLALCTRPNPALRM